VSQRTRFDVASLPAPVCAFCGEVIDEDGQRCPALDEGRCAA